MYTTVPESETIIIYPKSKRKKVFNYKGELVYDSAKDEQNKEIHTLFLDSKDG
jgi:hypothetical protein